MTERHCSQCSTTSDTDGGFCPVCGATFEGIARRCPHCSVVSTASGRFCSSCGGAYSPGAVQPSAGQPSSGKRLAAGLCGILIGALGIHKFVLGYTTAGLIMLLVSILTCGIGAIPMGIIGLIEGIIYLTKSEEEFDRIYVYGEKTWF